MNFLRKVASVVTSRLTVLQSNSTNQNIFFTFSPFFLLVEQVVLHGFPILVGETLIIIGRQSVCQCLFDEIAALLDFLLHLS